MKLTRRALVAFLGALVPSAALAQLLVTKVGAGSNVGWIDDNGITMWVDDNGISSLNWVDDNGIVG